MVLGCLICAIFPMATYGVECLILWQLIQSNVSLAQFFVQGFGEEVAGIVRDMDLLGIRGGIEFLEDPGKLVVGLCKLVISLGEILRDYDGDMIVDTGSQDFDLALGGQAPLHTSDKAGRIVLEALLLSEERPAVFERRFVVGNGLEELPGGITLFLCLTLELGEESMLRSDESEELEVFDVWECVSRSKKTEVLPGDVPNESALSVSPLYFNSSLLTDTYLHDCWPRIHYRTSISRP